jgi:hypothetical protein
MLDTRPADPHAAALREGRVERGDQTPAGPCEMHAVGAALGREGQAIADDDEAAIGRIRRGFDRVGDAASRRHEVAGHARLPSRHR